MSESKEQQSRLNIELFKKVREKIATTPEAYDQHTDHKEEPLAPCRTACCIGGWADILSAPTLDEQAKRLAGDVDLNRGADSLGLGGKDFWKEFGRSSERAVLFSSEPRKHWPQPFCGEWRRATTAIERSAVAVAYLTHVIETGKVLE